MKHTVSLTNNYEFGRLYKKGGCVVSGLLVVYYRKNGSDCCRLGITVSKKIGKAVIRNRAKRLIREAYRSLEPGVYGYDMVVVARGRIKDAAFADVSSCLLQLFTKSGIFKK